MNRRNFLKSGSVAGLAIGTVSIASCNTGTDKEKSAAKQRAF
ncbi:MAG: twin-arginine translocation signal domain-containing protein [Chitinophagaceae bacterium]|nr:twin-arginine translocation signal domain-containing protein [Chitinophagaceae bacterium]